MKRLINRTGWSLLSYLSIGLTVNSTPADPERDERAFCLLRSELVPMVTASPNPMPAHKQTATTTISWNTGTANPGKVYVSIDGQQELLFATSRQGSPLQIGSEPAAHTSSAFTIRITTGSSTK